VMTANTIMSIAHFPVTAVIANSSLKNSIQNNQPMTIAAIRIACGVVIGFAI